MTLNSYGDLLATVLFALFGNRIVHFGRVNEILAQSVLDHDSNETELELDSQTV